MLLKQLTRCPNCKQFCLKNADVNPDAKGFTKAPIYSNFATHCEFISDDHSITIFDQSI